MPTPVVDAFLQAYNSFDLVKLEDLMDPRIRLVHYGRGIEADGRDAVLALFAGSAEGPFPGRRFLPARARLVDGDRVAVDVWEATAQADVPGMARAGETVEMELCTIFTVRDGRIVAYDEYG